MPVLRSLPLTQLLADEASLLGSGSGTLLLHLLKQVKVLLNGLKALQAIQLLIDSLCFLLDFLVILFYTIHYLFLRAGQFLLFGLVIALVPVLLVLVQSYRIANTVDLALINIIKLMNTPKSIL